jgi:hypothetical protein
MRSTREFGRELPLLLSDCGALKISPMIMRRNPDWVGKKKKNFIIFEEKKKKILLFLRKEKKKFYYFWGKKKKNFICCFFFCGWKRNFFIFLTEKNFIIHMDKNILN